MPPQITKEAVEAATISAGNKVTLAGSGAAAVSTFLHSNLGVVAGIALGVLGYLTSLYFQWRRDRREQREYEKRMKKLQTQPGDLQ